MKSLALKINPRTSSRQKLIKFLSRDLAEESRANKSTFFWKGSLVLSETGSPKLAYLQKTLPKEREKIELEN